MGGRIREQVENMQKTRSNVHFVKETQELRTSGSQATRAGKVCAEEKSEDDVRIRLAYRSQRVFRQPKATKRAQYPSEIDKEPRRDNRSFRKLWKCEQKLRSLDVKKVGELEVSGLKILKKKVGVGRWNTEPKTSTCV